MCHCACVVVVGVGGGGGAGGKIKKTLSRWLVQTCSLESTTFFPGSRVVEDIAFFVVHTVYQAPSDVSN